MKQIGSTEVLTADRVGPGSLPSIQENLTKRCARE